VEPAWHPHVATLVRLGRATVVPVYFPGRNSAFFMLMGLLSPRLRTALLPRELVNRSRQRIALRIGRGIPWHRLRRFPDDKVMIDYLRLSTEVLSIDPSPREPEARLSSGPDRDGGLEPVIAPVSKQRMQSEIDRLPGDQCLLESGAFSVWLAQSGQIPHVLDEIGRLREITFRQVQEGTGRALDLDRFDGHYRHLFLWHRPKAELVGGYRLGPVDTILKERGLSGLYTQSLFRFGAEFLDQLPPAIEFGRSFIRPEYQKKFNSLILIWRGIGQLISRCPRYKILFGPVSISRDYEAVSKTLLVHFLKHNNFHDDLARYVAPRQPYRPQGIRLPDESVLQSAGWGIEEISFLISEIEKDGKGVPALLKHYLKLNGKLLSFNVDKAFSDVVDGLLMVDLRETDPKILKRFIGPVDLAKGITARPDAAFPTPLCGI
jgi:putative hemolysin